MDWEQLLNDLLYQAENLSFKDESSLNKIKSEIELIDEKVWGDKYAKQVHDLNFWVFFSPHPPQAEIDAWESGKDRLCTLINTMLKDISFSRFARESGTMCDNKKIFIVHGHNDALKFEVSDWVRSLNLEPIILHLQASGGTRSIIDKIERNSDVTAAIVLLTADDLGKAKEELEYKFRARQNVVFEAGYFIGKLNPDRVILLHEADIELPGDLGGCIYIPISGQWKDDIRKEFDEMQIPYRK